VYINVFGVMDMTTTKMDCAIDVNNQNICHLCFQVLQSDIKGVII